MVKIIIFMVVWIAFAFIGQYGLKLESFSYIMLLGFVAGMTASEITERL